MTEGIIDKPQCTKRIAEPHLVPASQQDTVSSFNESMRDDIRSATPNVIKNPDVPLISKGLLDFYEIPQTNQYVNLQEKFHQMPGYVPELDKGTTAVISPKIMFSTEQRPSEIGQFVMDH